MLLLLMMPRGAPSYYTTGYHPIIIARAAQQVLRYI